jgi:hypothetical protein
LRENATFVCPETLNSDQAFQPVPSARTLLLHSTFICFYRRDDSLQQLRGFVLTGPAPSCPGWVDACQLVQPLERRFEFEKAIHLFAAINLTLQASASLLWLNLRQLPEAFANFIRNLRPQALFVHSPSHQLRSVACHFADRGPILDYSSVIVSGFIAFLRLTRRDLGHPLQGDRRLSA